VLKKTDGSYQRNHVLDKQLQSLVNEIKAASGKIHADMHLTDLRILDVYTERVYPGSMVIKNGKIVAINPSWSVQAKQVFDGRGMLAVPGFMDAHVHIETTLLTPEALAGVIVPWGTTTMFVDAMEIANVLGIKGLRALLRNTTNLPFRTFMEVPSRVPTAPGLETTGGILGAEEVDELMDDPMAVSLGELDPSKVLEIKEEYLKKILSARRRNKFCNRGMAGSFRWCDPGEC